MISNIKPPDSTIARDAEEFARSVSSDMLFNHVMRCYWFAELYAQREDVTVDKELLFISATLHDLGLTDVVRGSHRFEIEGANAARTFLLARGVADDRAWRAWDNIALHAFDINFFRDDTSRLLQLGIRYDVRGDASACLEQSDIARIVHRYPRLGFKDGFYDLLRRDVLRKQPYPHTYHLCTCIAHEDPAVKIPDVHKVLDEAPFNEEFSRNTRQRRPIKSGTPSGCAFSCHLQRDGCYPEAQTDDIKGWGPLPCAIDAAPLSGGGLLFCDCKGTGLSVEILGKSRIAEKCDLCQFSPCFCRTISILQDI